MYKYDYYIYDLNMRNEYFKTVLKIELSNCITFVVSIFSVIQLFNELIDFRNKYYEEEHLYRNTKFNNQDLNCLI